MRSDRIAVLSPVSAAPGERRNLSPGVADLAGRRLGVRRDRTWRSFEVFADELARLARERLGSRETRSFDPGERIGAPEAESERIRAFAAEIDAAVVGLGT